MPSLIFKVITQKPIDIDFPEKMMFDYPVHEHYLIEASERIIIYKCNPTRKTTENWNCYIKKLEQFLKLKYQAYSVTYGGLQEQLKA